MRTLASFVVALSFIACSSSNPKKTPDAAVIDDAPPDTSAACVAGRTPEAVEYFTKDPTFPLVIWTSKITGGQDGKDLYLAYEFYGGAAITGTIDLATGDQANYKTCEVCMHANELDTDGTILKDYFQTAGTVMVAVDPVTQQHFMGSVTGLKLQEVTIDGNDATSTPVPGGACFGVADQTAIDTLAAPAGWTCTAPKFSDGTTCDCMCGVQDDDCDVDANSVVGCATPGNRCFAGGCVAPATNDTCQNAALLVLNTPVTSTTIGADRTYDAGLDATTCTGFGQPGPDVVYQIALTSGTSYTFTLSGLDPMYDGSISLLDPAGAGAAACDAAPIATCVKGADAGLAGANETFTYVAATTGIHYVIVDSDFPNGAASAGAFTLTVTSP